MDDIRKTGITKTMSTKNAESRGLPRGIENPESSLREQVEQTISQAHSPRQVTGRRRLVAFVVIMLAVLVVSMDNSILYIAMKTLAEPAPTGLGASQGQLQWCSDAYILVYAGLLLTGGVAGNRFGHRKVLLTGLAGFGLFSLLSAFAPSVGWLIGLRAVMGLFAALLMPATLAIITYLYPGAERAKAIGVWSSVVGAALALGPLAAGLLLTRFWWGSVFLVNTPVVLCAMVAVPLLVPEYRDTEKRRFDPMGTLLASVGLVLVVYGIIRAGDDAKWVQMPTLLPIVLGLVLLVLFAVWESRSDHPTLDVRYFKDRGFTVAALALALLFFALFGAVFVMTFYLQSLRGYTALQTGLCILPFAAAMVLCAPQAKRLAARYGARSVSGTGMLVIALAMIGLSRIGKDTGVWVFELLLFVFGAGMAMVMPPMTTRIVSTMPQNQAGTSSAVNNMFRQVGGSLGIAVLGSILSQRYQTGMRPHLMFLPVNLRDTASSSLTATKHLIGMAHQLPPQMKDTLLRQAESAFVTAQQQVWQIGACVALIAALLIFLFYKNLKNRETDSGVDE